MDNPPAYCRRCDHRLVSSNSPCPECGERASEPPHASPRRRKLTQATICFVLASSSGAAAYAFRAVETLTYRSIDPPLLSPGEQAVARLGWIGSSIVAVLLLAQCLRIGVSALKFQDD